MILTVQIKLVPSKEQARLLKETVQIANRAANELSGMCWDRKIFGRIPVQRAFYRTIRESFPLSAQTVCLTIGKVADAYKTNPNSKSAFRPMGSIAYDARVLDFQIQRSTVSIWSVGGRIKRLPFVCVDKQKQLLQFKILESDLIFRKNKWLLNVAVSVPPAEEINAVDFLGVDFGVEEIAVDSDGNKYSGRALNKVRHRNRALRKKLQSKGTKSAKRLLRKRSQKERRFSRNTNHIISKRIVSHAKRTNRGIAIENLLGIRARARVKKGEGCTLHNWAFAQLGDYISYKAKRDGVRLVKIDPSYTSQSCSKCGHTSKANRKSRDRFVCELCGHTAHADENGAENIRLKGMIASGSAAFNQPNASVITYGKIHERIQLQSTTFFGCRS